MADKMESTRLLSKPPLRTGTGQSACKNGTDYYKLFQTTCLGLANSLIGMVMGLHGASYLDLLLISSSNIQNGALIFAIAGVGAIFGSISAGPLCNRCPTELMVALSILGTGIFTTVIPWFPNLYFMLVFNCLAWICLGISEAAILLLVIDLWKSEGAYITHVIYLCFAIGGIIGPIITEPFLYHKTGDVFIIYDQSVISNLSLETTDTNAHTRIWMPYFIVGVICMFVTLMWTGIYLKNRKFLKTDINYNVEDLSRPRQTKFQPKEDLIVLIFTGLFYLLYEGIENGTHYFLMTFLVEQFGWSKSNGSKALALFWASYAVGQILGFVMSKLLSPYSVLTISLLGVNITFLLWIVMSKVDMITSWAIVSLLGLFMSPIFPAGITFINSYQSGVSSNAMAWIMTCADIGNTLDPLLIGYLLQETFPESYLYLLMTESAVSLGILFTIGVVVNICKVFP